MGGRVDCGCEELLEVPVVLTVDPRLVLFRSKGEVRVNEKV